MTDFKMCCLYVVLVLPGSVETQLGEVGNFFRVFLPVSAGTNCLKIDQVIIKNKVARFLWFTVYILVFKPLCVQKSSVTRI